MTPSPQFKRCIVGMIVVLSVLIGGLVATDAHLSGFGNALYSVKTAKSKPAPSKSTTPVKMKQRDVRQIGAAGYLNVERRGHTATPLADGRLLIIGGENENGPVAEVEIFDPSSRTFSLAGRSITPRADHTATKLADGRVMIIGGRGQDGPLNSTEVYDPAANSFSHGPILNHARAGHSATVLADGRILIAGGETGGSAEILDSEKRIFTTIEARLNDPRSAHGAFLMRDGRVLIAGGIILNDSALGTAEIFDPNVVRFFTTNNRMHAARVRPTLRVLPDGKVQIIGGDKETTMEMYNPERARFSASAHLLDNPDAFTTVLRAPTRAALIHEKSALAVRPAKTGATDAKLSDMLDRKGSSLTELPGANQAVVVGGINSNGSYLKSFVSLTSSSASVTTDKIDYVPGERVIISGTGWLPGETVSMYLHREPQTSPDLTFSSTADSSGNFTNNSYIVGPNDIGVTFTLTATGLTSGRTAQTTFTDANLVTDFRQSANNDGGFGLGKIHWINSIVQSSNSKYFEGMSNFQRSLFDSVPVTTGNNHSLSLSHQFTKAGIHAYDFLTSYVQAKANDEVALGVPITLNPCGVEIGPPGSLGSMCVALRGSATATVGPGACAGCAIDVDIPDDTYMSKDGSTAARIAAYEATNGNRTIRLYGNAPITVAALTLSHSVAAAGDTGDSDVSYILTWQSTSTTILVEMAGHLAVTGDGTGVSWGPGLGSSQISGGPYHFNLDKLGGAVVGGAQTEVTSLGSQDNQIKGADVLVPCPTCSVAGPASVCGGSTNTYTETITGTCNNQVISWSITGNGSISGSTTGSSVNVLAGSGSGSYTITATVTCANCPSPGVSCSQTVTVNDVTLSLTETDVSCNGGSDGTVTATFSGGTAPYTASIDGGAAATATSPKTFSGLSAGSHSVTVTDSGGCSKTTSIMVNEPTAVTLSLTKTDISCNGGSDGSVTATFGGGTGPYTISLDGGAFAAATSPKTFSSVSAGSHTVTVKDANGCTKSDSITVNQSAAVTLSLSKTDVSCNGGTDGSVTATFSGGTGPYTASIDGGAFAVAISPKTFSGLSAGSHSVTVRDANGCTASKTITITEPTKLVASSSATPILCNGGDSTVTVSASGGTAPYTGSGAFTKKAGTYTFTVTDANGCTASTTVTITEPTVLTASSSATPILCNGGSSTVTVSASGGTAPYTGTGMFSRTAGTYTFTVTAANRYTATPSVR